MLFFCNFIAECDFSFLQTRISPPLVGISLPLVQIQPQQLQLITRTQQLHHRPSILEKMVSSHDVKEAQTQNTSSTSVEHHPTTTTTRPHRSETTMSNNNYRPCSPDTPIDTLMSSSSAKNNRNAAIASLTANTSSSINETTFVSISSTNSRFHPLMRGQAAPVASTVQSNATRSHLPTGATRLSAMNSTAAVVRLHDHRLTHTSTPTTATTPPPCVIATAATAVSTSNNTTRPYIKVITLNHHHPPPPPLQQSFRVLEPHASRLCAAAVAVAPAGPAPVTSPRPTALTSTATCRPTSFTTALIMQQQQPLSLARPQPHAAHQLKSPHTDTRRVAFESSTMTRYANKPNTSHNESKSFSNNYNTPSPMSSFSSSANSISCCNMCSSFYSVSTKVANTNSVAFNSRSNKLDQTNKSGCYNRGKSDGKCKYCTNVLTKMSHNVSNISSSSQNGDEGCSYSKYSNIIPFYV
jgi:hypothetical protein